MRIKKARALLKAGNFPALDLSVRFQSGEITKEKLKGEVFKLILENHLEDVAVEFRNAIKAAQEADMTKNVLVYDAESFVIDFAEERLK